MGWLRKIRAWYLPYIVDFEADGDCGQALADHLGLENRVQPTTLGGTLCFVSMLLGVQGFLAGAMTLLIWYQGS